MINSLIAWSQILQHAEHWAIYPGVTSLASSLVPQGLVCIDDDGDHDLMLLLLLLLMVMRMIVVAVMVM